MGRSVALRAVALAVVCRCCWGDVLENDVISAASTQGSVLANVLDGMLGRLLPDTLPNVVMSAPTVTVDGGENCSAVNTLAVQDFVRYSSPDLMNFLSMVRRRAVVVWAGSAPARVPCKALSRKRFGPSSTQLTRVCRVLLVRWSWFDDGRASSPSSRTRC